MAVATITSGICGFVTKVEARQEGDRCVLSFETDCPNVERLAEELQAVDPWGEISYHRGRPLTMTLSEKHLQHPACPVPSGVIKAVEVACELAFPKAAHIDISND